ncbi:hypothetical protein VCRA2121O391_300028 [Vibrio crassostreae]|nr:hypothetical protein VCRA2117O378_320028 [Vibrio crassostreae]CAK2063029.1 hypothetical protein VCRA2113O356_370032 [Vibrio crassostreae]CAK2349059.1 hypothetical protein VCRA2119O386_340028 [Vibrio crassostreae]CAK2750570.1 hypothetical protein VCRA2117O375_290029 [Vibrio crassostreae]CAK2866755.1 hypothetical protein VCRA2121O391_300028 [Vibrio crassostreae]
MSRGFIDLKFYLWHFPQKVPASSDLPHIQRDIVKLKLFAFCVSNFYELGLLDLIELTVTGRVGYFCNLLIFL